MRGHLVQRGDRYDAVVYEGIDPATGKERHRWYPAGTTRRGAEKVLGDLVKRTHDGDDRAPERITFSDYLRRRESVDGVCALDHVGRPTLSTSGA